MRKPQPKQWLSDKVSQGYVGDYKPFMFVDGEGVRCSLYVSGCLFACDGCFNRATWNFRYGTPYTAELEDRIIADLRQSYVQGLTLLGGEPFLNTGVCLSLVRRVRAEFGDTKDIWSWSGYTYEELLLDSDDKRELLQHLDVLVDGPFDRAQQDFSLQFRGSANQRIIDVPRSRDAGKAQLWAKQADAHRSYERIDTQPLI
jgi:anaerobic ribonucleoside-triphosphate reductase activating protein